MQTKWCYFHGRNEPIEAFAANANKPDGLQSECRQAQAERRGRTFKRVLGIGVGVAIAMALHTLFAGVLGVFGAISGAMPWNWFSDAGMDIGGGDKWEVVPVDPTPIDFPDDIVEQPESVEIIEADIPENYPYRLPDQEPDIAVGYGENWRAS